MRTLLLIGAGGFIGSAARYLTSIFVTRQFSSSFPYGTLTVNITGSLLIGLIFGLSERFNWPAPDWRLFLATGFCGGFTTFSSFSYETINILRDGDWFLGLANIALSVILCLVATVAGTLIIRLI